MANPQQAAGQVRGTLTNQSAHQQYNAWKAAGSKGASGANAPRNGPPGGGANPPPGFGVRMGSKMPFDPPQTPDGMGRADQLRSAISQGKLPTPLSAAAGSAKVGTNDPLADAGVGAKPVNGQPGAGPGIGALTAAANAAKTTSGQAVNGQPTGQGLAGMLSTVPPGGPNTMFHPDSGGGAFPSGSNAGAGGSAPMQTGQTPWNPNQPQPLPPGSNPDAGGTNGGGGQPYGGGANPPRPGMIPLPQGPGMSFGPNPNPPGLGSTGGTPWNPNQPQPLPPGSNSGYAGGAQPYGGGANPPRGPQNQLHPGFGGGAMGTM